MNEAEEGKNILGILFGTPEENLPITTNSDLSSYLGLHLQNLQQQILKAIPTITDKDSKDHLKYIADQIKNKLDGSFAQSVKEPNK